MTEKIVLTAKMETNFISVFDVRCFWMNEAIVSLISVSPILWILGSFPVYVTLH